MSNEAYSTLDNYRLLGNSGLRVSPLCLGTMTFGQAWSKEFGNDLEESKKVFDYYYEKGGNFFDTANLYTNGESERFLGQYIADKRSQCVIATKYTLNTSRGSSRVNPNAGGNQRKNLVESLDDSLKRLGTGYVDLYYVHVHDYATPTHEVMRALDDVVRSGKALYVAVSDAPAWTISRANTLAELRGWSQFIGLQTRYNLLDRSFEYELEPMATEMGLGTIPWGIIAEGFLTGKHKRNEPHPDTGRLNSLQKHFDKEKNWDILDKVIEIAKEINRKPVQVALNWILQKPGITSPLIGAKNLTQLKENLEALDFTLSKEQMASLDQVSAPAETPFPASFTEFSLGIATGHKLEYPDKYKPFLKLVGKTDV